jgi:hypothetical protein
MLSSAREKSRVSAIEINLVQADNVISQKSTPNMKIKLYTGGAPFDIESRIEIFLKPEVNAGAYGAVSINGRYQWVIVGGNMRENAWDKETEIFRHFSGDRLTGLNDDGIEDFMHFMMRDPDPTFIFDIVNQEIQILYHIEKRIDDDKYTHHRAELVANDEYKWARRPDPCRSYIYDSSQPRKWLTGSLTLDIRRI